MSKKPKWKLAFTACFSSKCAFAGPPLPPTIWNKSTITLRSTEPHLSRSTVIEIRDSIASLKNFPHRGRHGAVEGTRELLHKRLPYIVVYRVKAENVEILHIWHPSQDRP